MKYPKDWGAAEYAAIILDYPFDHPNIKKIRRKEKIRMEKTKMDRIMEEFIEDKQKSKFQVLVEKNLENLEKCREDIEHVCISYSHIEPLKSIWDDKMIKITTIMPFEQFIYEMLKLNDAGIYIDNIKSILFYDSILDDNNDFYDENGNPNKEYEKTMEAKVCLAKQKNEQNRKYAAFDVEITQFKAGYSLVEVKDIHWRRKKYIELSKDADGFIDEGYPDFTSDTKVVLNSEKLLDMIAEGIVYITNSKFLDYYLFHETYDKDKIDSLFDYYIRGRLI